MTPKIPKSLIDHMVKASKDCIRKNPELADHPFLCENIYISPQQGKGSFDLHTHTIAGIDYPSPPDVKTHKNLKKESLCIINTVDQTLTCHKISSSGHFTRSQKHI